MKAKAKFATLQSYQCQVCGKAGQYPNFILSHGRQMHIGCMADLLDRFIRDARLIVQHWERGDLALDVRELHATLNKATNQKP